MVEIHVPSMRLCCIFASASDYEPREGELSRRDPVSIVHVSTGGKRPVRTYSHLPRAMPLRSFAVEACASVVAPRSNSCQTARGTSPPRSSTRDSARADSPRRRLPPRPAGLVARARTVGIAGFRAGASPSPVHVGAPVPGAAGHPGAGGWPRGTVGACW
jgi:hypothetical protein